jgi:hypothetical protein
MENHRRNNVDDFFINGKISFVLDASFGSSGKGKISSYLVKKSSKVNFLATSNSANASHTVVDNDKEYVFKVLPAGSLYHEKLDAIYICPGACFEIDALFKEIEMCGIPKEKVKIHPRAGIITQIDIDFEKGLCDLDGNYYTDRKDGTISTGSTCSGSGAVLAKKTIRNKTLKTATDFTELTDMLCITELSMITELALGKCGLFDIGQGFPLSNNHYRFAPNTTSRNVTVSAALNDAMLPPHVAGSVLLNLRTYPIRINSKKYIMKDGKRHLTWDEVKSGLYDGQYDMIDSYSGDFYGDQKEISWEEIMESSGVHIPDKVINTTLTKLPRRVATFSKNNLAEAILYNSTVHKTYLCLNFVNWIDGEIVDEDTALSSSKLMDFIILNMR